MSEKQVVQQQAAQSPAPVSIDNREAKLKIYDRFLATVSALGLIAGGIWGVYSFSETKRKETEQKKEEAIKTAELRQKEILLRKHELNLLIFKERKEAYYALCDAVCDIAACRDRKEVIERSHNFLKLYNGRAHIIANADQEVSDLKVEFKAKLMKYLDGEDKNSNVSPFTYFQKEAYEITKACGKNVDPRNLKNIETD